jgi:hypothetical protein
VRENARKRTNVRANTPRFGGRFGLASVSFQAISMGRAPALALTLLDRRRLTVLPIELADAT